ncbi:hypothetical protein SB5439_04997 [Klebsiella variicola]|uniref:glycosyltransferase family 2 protein n=1 Tax=Klebsiella variicola TaxID=244366 RepID=UPI00109D255A|nr:glycosyltransferase family A protein [Klebsiella variicola]VGQ11805.1 hypothetical protein SB5439_04997 [Klebsiella variicola]
MKVGIGIITAGVRGIREDYKKHTTNGEIFIYTDKERRGPGHARNQVLKYFEGFDHIFLFDDDCYPTLQGWENYFIDFAVKHSIDYMCLPEVFKTGLVSTEGELTRWDGGLGAFTYLSNKGLKTIGGYNKNYKRYGLEDVAYRFRAQRAGLTGALDSFAFPLRGLAYIHSMDVFAENPTPNMSNTDKRLSVSINQPIYNQEMASDQLYYDYT